jgi:hypothetical protein
MLALLLPTSSQLLWIVNIYGFIAGQAGVRGGPSA